MILLKEWIISLAEDWEQEIIMMKITPGLIGWAVPHNIADMVSLMGGNEKFVGNP